LLAFAARTFAALSTMPLPGFLLLGILPATARAALGRRARRDLGLTPECHGFAPGRDRRDHGLDRRRAYRNLRIGETAIPKRLREALQAGVQPVRQARVARHDGGP
jgi:hypothetical protein